MYFPGLITPVLTAVDVTLLAGSGIDRVVVCVLKPFISWILYVPIFTILPISLLYKLVFLINIVVRARYNRLLQFEIFFKINILNIL